MDNGIKILNCPAGTTLRLTGDKRKVPIVRGLPTGTRRFNELMQSISGITRKVLTSRLRAMEQAGLVTREIYSRAPPKARCALAETRYSLKPIPNSMTAWGTAYEKNIR